MKAPHVHAALAVVMATCMTPTGLAFLPPPAALTRSRASVTAVGSGQGAAAPAARLASRLPAAREDCKSCMEAELLEEERKRADMDGEDGGKRVAARRAALEEVRLRAFRRAHFKPRLISLSVTQNQPPTQRSKYCQVL